MLWFPSFTDAIFAAEHTRRHSTAVDVTYNTFSHAHRSRVTSRPVSHMCVFTMARLRKGGG